MAAAGLAKKRSSLGKLYYLVLLAGSIALAAFYWILGGFDAEIYDVPTLLAAMDSIQGPSTSRQLQSFTFIHIPKCGGTSVTHHLWKGAENLWPNLIEHKRGQPVDLQKSYRIHTMQGSKTTLTTSEFGCLSNAKLNRFLMLSGHIPHGPCQLLRQPCGYATVMREPRARLISEVYWIQKMLPQTRNVTVSEFIEGTVSPGSKFAKYCVLMDNHETRLLSGDAYESFFYEIGDRTPCGNMTDRHAERAIFNLRHESMIQAGRLERLDLFFTGLQRQMGPHFDMGFGDEGPQSIVALNVRPSNRTEQQLTAKAEEIVKRFIQYDERVYQAMIDWWELGKRPTQ